MAYHKLGSLFGNMGPSNSLVCIFSQQSNLSKIFTIYILTNILVMFDMTYLIIMIRNSQLIKSTALKHFEYFYHRSFVDENKEPLCSKNLFSIQSMTKRDDGTYNLYCEPFSLHVQQNDKHV